MLGQYPDGFLPAAGECYGDSVLDCLLDAKGAFLAQRFVSRCVDDFANVLSNSQCNIPDVDESAEVDERVTVLSTPVSGRVAAT